MLSPAMGLVIVNALSDAIIISVLVAVAFPAGSKAVAVSVSDSSPIALTSASVTATLHVPSVPTVTGAPI